MKTETMQINILTPSDNHFLFNENEKIISSKVFISSQSSAEDWKEITAEEKESLEKLWENEINAEVM